MSEKNQRTDTTRMIENVWNGEKQSQQSLKSLKLREDRYNLYYKENTVLCMRALPHWYLHFIQFSFDSDYRVTSAAPLLDEQIKRQNVDKYCVKKWQILASLKNWQILRPVLTTTTASQLKEQKSALSKCPLTSASQCCVKVLCQENNEFKDNMRNCSVRVCLHLFNSNL